MKKFLVPAAVMVLFVSGCAGSKATEQFNDAKVSGQNTRPAAILNFPDGYSNVATKCDNGNRVYVLFHNDAPYGALAVVPDAKC